MNSARRLGWLGIVRLGLVQSALGAIVVLVTSTLNRVMVVEYQLPAMLPGALVALHYAVQMSRPRFGFGAGRGGRTRWILGGIAVLGLGGVLCAMATVSMAAHALWGFAFAIVAYAVVGFGVGAAGTSLLVLLASEVDEPRRAAAATIMWVLMIAGFAVTSTLAGHFLDPYSPQRLMMVMATAALAAFAVAVAAVWGIERQERAPEAQRHAAVPAQAAPAERAVPANRGAPAERDFRAALRRVWAEPEARRFTVFVFVSMLAYSAQELLMEPFAGLVFGYSLGASAALSGQQHAGVFLGMIAVGLACSGGRRLGGPRLGGPRFGSLRSWTIGGCVASALALLSLVAANLVGPEWPLQASVFALGLANGVFAVAAIGSMMALAHQGEAPGAEAPGAGAPGAGAPAAGVRMGLWGAAQAVAFALGGLFSTTLVDCARHFLGSPAAAFGIVFCAEAALFIIAARLAARMGSTGGERIGASRAGALGVLGP
jgi:BCD family chlorophyll transporter-like MFS transporter